MNAKLKRHLKLYSSDFFKGQQDGSIKSAEIVVPILIDAIRPSSVVDVGCGIGTWLSVFEKKGINDYVGIDGDYINKEQLLIPSEKYKTQNLEEPFALDRKFDLAICMEVAEHLNPATSKQFIKSITDIAPAVFFSAAIPFQMGTGHINEQWQTYWADLFSHFKYKPVSLVREQIWGNKDVEVWYRQNALLYIREDLLSSTTIKVSANDVLPKNYISVVHPELFLSAVDPKKITVTRFVKTLGAFPYVLTKLVNKLMGRNQ